MKETQSGIIVLTHKANLLYQYCKNNAKDDMVWLTHSKVSSLMGRNSLYKYTDELLSKGLIEKTEVGTRIYKVK